MKIKKLRELTRAEEEVMQVLWKLESGFVKDMLEFFDNPNGTLSCCRRAVTSEVYDPSEFKCCSGTLNPIQGRTSLSCCGIKAYEYDSEICCDPRPWPRFDKDSNEKVLQVYVYQYLHFHRCLVFHKFLKQFYQDK